MVGLMPVQTMADEFDDYFGNGDDNVLYVMLAVMTEDYLPVGEGYYTIMQSAGTNVDLKNYVPAGYTIVSVQVAGDTSQFTVDGDWCFTMPNAPGELLAFVAPDNGGSTPQPPQQPDPQPPQQTTKYTVTVKTEGNGTASANVTEAAVGDSITIKPVPGAEGIWAAGIHGTQTSTYNPVAPIDRSGDNFVFTMPEDNVVITVHFNSFPTITVIATENGEITDAPGSAKPGTPVTFTPQPAEGYRVKDVVIESQYNGSVTPTRKDNGSYEFTMPYSNTVITANYALIPTYDINVVKPAEVELDLPEKAEEGAKITVVPTITGNYIPTITVTGPNGEEVKLDGSQFVMPAYPVTITVTLDPAVTVTFHPEDGKSSNQKFTIKKDTSMGELSELREPTWKDHIFMGWYLDNGQKASAQTTFSEDTDVFAYWSTVAYEATDGIAISGLTEEEMDHLLKKAEEEGKVTLGNQYNAIFYLDKKEAAPANEAQTAIVRKASGDQVAAYLDLQWYVKVDGGTPVPISNDGESALIEMSLTNVKLPDNLVYDSFYIIYYHKGEAKIIWNTTFDVASKVLKFEASEFSPYALVCKTYEIKFSPDGGNGTMDSIFIKPGDFVLPDNHFNPPSGKEFGGWKYGNEIKQPGEKIRPTANTTITAVWKDKVSAASTGVLDNVPKTGDSAPLMGYSLLVLCSAAMLAAVAFFDKKRVR